MTEDARLSRIEAKVDALTNAMTALVRAEERIATIFSRLEAIDRRMERNAERLDALDKASRHNGQTLRFGERLFWVIATSGVAMLFTLMEFKG